MDENKKTGLSIASLTLGIISIISAFFYYISLPASILAIVFGAKSLKSKLGKAGMILGIIGLSLCIFIYATCIIIITLSNV